MIRRIIRLDTGIERAEASLKASAISDEPSHSAGDPPGGAGVYPGTDPEGGATVANGVDILEELVADEGMRLTQAADVDISERVTGSRVMLGAGCDASQWREITEAEALEIERQIKNRFTEGS